MKKFLALALALVTAMALMTGCGGDTKTDGGSADGGSASHLHSLQAATRVLTTVSEAYSQVR